MCRGPAMGSVGPEIWTRRVLSTRATFLGMTTEDMKKAES